MVNAWNAGGLALVRRLSRGSRALEIAADELDVGLDLLCERATADDVRLELLARVLEAAGRTPLKEKIPALGLVLADGLREGGNVDEAFLLAAALDDLEAPHVRSVAHMTDTAHVPAGTRASWGRLARGRTHRAAPGPGARPARAHEHSRQARTDHRPWQLS